MCVWRKLKNKMNQKWWIYYKGKFTLKCFGFNESSSGLEDGETSVDKTIMDV